MDSNSTSSDKPTKGTSMIQQLHLYDLTLKLFACLQKLWQSRPHPLTFIQRQWHTFALVILYIFFRPTFEKHIAPLFAQFDPSPVSTYIWFGLIIATICYTIILIRRRYVLSEGGGLWALVTLLGWWYYRFKGVPNYEVTKIPAEWTSQYISNIDLLYIDLLLVIGGCIIVVQVFSCARSLGSCLCRLWKRKQANRDAGIEGYIVDYPITAEDEDRLGRSKKAFDLAKKIFYTDTSRAAFILGFTAPWGAGKTSFILAMQQYLKDNHCNEIILLDFNPWMYRKAPNLTQVFFEELSRTLAPYSSALASGFMQYVDYILSKQNNTWIQLGARLLPQGFKAKSTREQYEFLMKEICKLGRKIVIFIDDVDRLDGEELAELFSLVRNISSFPNMSYILAYDKEYVTNQFKKKFDKHTYRYMEKIIQVEYPLSEITPKQIKNELEKVLGTFEQTYPNLQKEIMSSGIELKQHFPTLRSIKCIQNTLLSTPEELKGNVIPFDWFIIELIRIEYPLLFDFLKENYVRAFDNRENGRLVINIKDEEEGQETSMRSIMSEHPTEGDVINFSSHFKLNKEQVPANKIGLALELMQQLWGEQRGYAHRQANHWEYIGIYFYRTMSEDDINTAELRQYLALDISSSQRSKNKIKGYIDLMLNSSRWLTFCEAVCEMKVDSLEKTINILYLAFYMLSREGRRWLQNVSEQIDKCIDSIREYEGEGAQKQRLKELFDYSDIRKGVLLYISSILNRAEEVRIPFSSDELEAIKEKLFLEYTQDDTSIDPIDCYRLWFKCQTRYEDNIGSKVIRPIDPERSSQKVNERMRNIITSNIERLIPHLIQESNTRPNNTYKLLLPYPIWTLDPEEVTEKIKYFPDFIAELDTSSSEVIKEFQVFFNEWYDYILKLKGYLENPQDQASYHRLTRTDQAIITEWQMRYPEYLQSLQNNSRACFRLLRYSLFENWGFITFKFNAFKPWDITIDRSKE